MHPAYSVIFFTTASGAGYGLIALMALFGVLNGVPLNPWFGAVGFGIGTLLGHERAAVIDRPSRPPRTGMARL
jgi:DMSO reductase anchor subunit